MLNVMTLGRCSDTWKMPKTKYRLDDEKTKRIKNVMSVRDLVSLTISVKFEARLIGKHSGCQDLVNRVEIMHRMIANTARFFETRAQQ